MRVEGFTGARGGRAWRAALVVAAGSLSSRPGRADEPPDASPDAPQQPPAAAPEKADGIAGFGIYRPNYFVTGYGDVETKGGAPDAKFQLSVRYDLLVEPTERWRVTLAYTQRSFWNIYDRSAPFRESNYAPELFVQWDARLGALRWTTLGYAHESNGVAEAASRSWDRFVARASIALPRVELEPSVWVPFRLSDNPDLLRSYGYGSLLATVDLGANSHADIEARVGSRFGRAGVSVGVDVDVPRLFGVGPDVVWNWFTPKLFAQAWHGYGESLLLYDVRTTAFRAGVLLRR